MNKITLEYIKGYECSYFIGTIEEVEKEKIKLEKKDIKQK